MAYRDRSDGEAVSPSSTKFHDKNAHLGIFSYSLASRRVSKEETINLDDFSYKFCMSDRPKCLWKSAGKIIQKLFKKVLTLAFFWIIIEVASE